MQTEARISNKSFALDMFKVAGAYLAFFIGSGYATGQEILQFFTAFGWWGFATAIVGMALFVWMGSTMIRDGRRLNFHSDSLMWKYYCGNILGRAMDYFAVFIQFGIFVVMIGGAGAAVEQYLGIPNMVGRVAMCVVCFLSVLLGLNKLVDVLSIIGPVIIIFAIAVGTYTVITNFGSISEVSTNVSQVTILASCKNPILSGFLYAGFNAMFVLPFLFNMGPTVKSMKSGRMGGALGGVLLAVAIMIMLLAQLLCIGSLYNASIPTLVLTNKISPILGGVFTVIVLLGIYSTGVTLLWLVCNRFGSKNKKAYVTTNCVAVVAALILSVLPFTQLVNIIYSYSGYIGIAAMLIFMARQTFLRKKGRMKTFRRIDDKARAAEAAVLANPEAAQAN